MTAWLTVVGIGDDGYAGPDAVRGAHCSTRRSSSARSGISTCCRAAAGRARSVAVAVRSRGRAGAARVARLRARQRRPDAVRRRRHARAPAFPDEWRVLPAPSSLSLAAARLGWALQEVGAVSLVGRPLATLARHLPPGRRLFVLSADGRTPAAVAAELVARGFGPTRISVFEHLGGPLERRLDGLAQDWRIDETAALNLVALDCQAGPDAPRRALTPGLPDDAYRHDGQLTKRDLRAMTLGRLAPRPASCWGCRRRQRLDRHRMDARASVMPGDRDRSACGAAALHRAQPRRARRAGPAARRGPRARRARGLAAPDAIFIGGGRPRPACSTRAGQR